jgi:hypothetical protein
MNSWWLKGTSMKFTVFITGSVMWLIFCLCVDNASWWRKLRKDILSIFFYFATTPLILPFITGAHSLTKPKHFSSKKLSLFKRVTSRLHIWDTCCIHLCQCGVSGQASVLGRELPLSSVCEAGWARKMVWGWENINSISH